MWATAWRVRLLRSCLGIVAQVSRSLNHNSKHGPLGKFYGIHGVRALTSQAQGDKAMLKSRAQTCMKLGVTIFRKHTVAASSRHQQAAGEGTDTLHHARVCTK